MDHFLEASSYLERDRVLAAQAAHELFVNTPIEGFTEAVELAARLCDTKSSFFSIVGQDCQWIEASVGMDTRESGIEDSICRYTFELDGPLVVEDARQDPRFAKIPAVESGEIIFYAGVTVRDPDGHPLGALCVSDAEPRRLIQTQIDSLEKLATVVESKIAFFITRNLALKQEEELRRRQAIFEILVTEIPEIFWIIELENMTVDFVSPAIEKFYGISPAEFLKGLEPWLERVPSAHQTEEMLQQLTERPHAVDVRYQLEDGRGALRWLHSRSFPIPGDKSRIAGITVDVTQQMRLEMSRTEALERAERDIGILESQQEQIFQKTTHAHITCTMEGEINSVNPQARALLGDRTTVEGRSILEFVSEDSREEFKDHFGRTSEHGVWSQLELVSDSGRRFSAEVSVSLIQSDEAGFYHIAFRDVSEMLRVERALEDARRELAQQKKFEALGQLAGGIAHDFNNMLSVIKSYAQFASSATEEDETREDIEVIIKTSDRAADLTRKLLSFARRQDGDTEVNEIGPILVEACDIFRRTLGATIEVECDIAEGGLEAEISGSDLQQIVMNLVLNARDALGERGGTVSVRTRRESGHVVICIGDNGPGIPPDVVERIFDPFFTTKDRGSGSGTGLGLATVQSLVHQHGGRIEVETSPGDGTTFEIYLPMAAPGAASSLTPDNASDWSAVALERILLVDDELALRDALERTLLENDYEVRAASNGREALELAKQYKFDVIVTDVRMPEINGPQLVEAMRERGYSGPVLYISDDFSQRRPEAVLPKPFTPDELIERLQELTGQA